MLLALGSFLIWIKIFQGDILIILIIFKFHRMNAFLWVSLGFLIYTLIYLSVQSGFLFFLHESLGRYWLNFSESRNFLLNSPGLSPSFWNSHLIICVPDIGVKTQCYIFIIVTICHHKSFKEDESIYRILYIKIHPYLFFHLADSGYHLASFSYCIKAAHLPLVLLLSNTLFSVCSNSYTAIIYTLFYTLAF